MKPSTRLLALGLLLSVTAPCRIVLAADPGEQLLLDRANYWRAHDRLDLATGLLDKVLAVNPKQPDALYLSGLLALQRSDAAASQGFFDRLRQLAAADPDAAELVKTLPTVAAASPGAAPSEALVMTTTGDDVTPASPAAPAPAQPAPLAEQVAALPGGTVADTSPDVSDPAPVGSSSTKKPVQVAQVEMLPPPPVNGYGVPSVAVTSADDTLELDINNTLLQIQAETNPVLQTGIGFRMHPGDSGTTRLLEVGTPVDFSFSPWLTGRARLSVVPVYLQAGSPNDVTLERFGANPILVANSLPADEAGRQRAYGTGIVGAYSFEDLSAQLGTTPLGFPVEHLIGDAAYSPHFLNNTLSMRFEALRAPVIDSVLSYAGTHATLGTPNTLTGGAFGTNGTWGGVVKTGGQVGIFYDDTEIGAYGSGGWSALTGTNVENNTMVNALAGAYMRPFHTDDMALRIGIALFYMQYDKNLSGFGFGQGGYFSPQNYEALTFPIEYTGRSGNWTYMAAVALGFQQFDESRSPVFPTSPVAQAQLVNLVGVPGAFNFQESSLGPAYSLKGQVEYAIDNTLSVGLYGSLDNGKNYTEGVAKFYVRKTFDWFTPMTSGPDPAVAKRDLPQSPL
jgi:hypothetical protein